MSSFICHFICHILINSIVIHRETLSGANLRLAVAPPTQGNRLLWWEWVERFCAVFLYCSNCLEFRERDYNRTVWGDFGYEFSFIEFNSNQHRAQHIDDLKKNKEFNSWVANKVVGILSCRTCLGYSGKRQWTKLILS